MTSLTSWTPVLMTFLLLLPPFFVGKKWVTQIGTISRTGGLPERKELTATPGQKLKWVMVITKTLDFWRAKVSASGNSEEIDFTYLIIGVTLGAFLAIGFIAVIICMIKKQMLDHVFRESEGKMDRRSNVGSSQNRDDTNTPEQQSINKQ